MTKPRLAKVRALFYVYSMLQKRVRNFDTPSRLYLYLEFLYLIQIRSNGYRRNPYGVADWHSPDIDGNRNGTHLHREVSDGAGK